MALGDVPDLVGEHGGEQVIVVADHLVEAAGDEDVAAGRGEGVDGGAVEHTEAPGERGAVRVLGEGATDEVDAAQGGLIANEAAVLGDDFDGDGAADDTLLFNADAGHALDDLGAVLGVFEDLVGLGAAGDEVAEAAELRVERGGQCEEGAEGNVAEVHWQSPFFSVCM